MKRDRCHPTLYKVGKQPNPATEMIVSYRHWFPPFAGEQSIACQRAELRDSCAKSIQPMRWKIVVGRGAKAF
jgi:hypothetical protein